MGKASKALAALLVWVLLLGLFVGCSGQTDAPSSETEPVSAPAVTRDMPPEFEPDFSTMDADGKHTFTGRDAVGGNGIVASGSVLASRAGLEIIMAGGNAVDAAVATSFALTVVEPGMTSIGGGGFMNISLADGTEVFLDGREIASMYATPDIWQLDAQGDVIGNQKVRGGKAICTPTLVATLVYALEHYGTMDLAEVMAPAIRLAEEGFEVTPTFRSNVESAMGDLRRYIHAAKVYLPNGLPAEVGTHFQNPDLGKTLRIIADRGAEGFYTGEVADAIVDTVNTFGGVMTHDDLLKAMAEQPVIRETVKGTYRGYGISSSPPASSGGTHVIEILNILENFDLSEVALNSPEYIHLVTEATKLAFNDRTAYMGDPAFADLPIYGLINKDYAAALAAQIDPAQATDFEGPGDPWPYDSADSPYVGGRGGAGYEQSGESQDTTHFSIADKDGNMVAMTQTIQQIFGSCVMADGYGFMFNDQANDFVTGWDLPNSIAGGKKPLSSMSPTIVRTPEGDPFLVVGSPGATRIFQYVVQTISKVIDYDMDIQDALSSPNFAWDNGARMIIQDTVIPLPDFDEVAARLTAMGHRVEPTTGVSALSAAIYLPDGTLRGAGDPRRDNKALGY